MQQGQRCGSSRPAVGFSSRHRSPLEFSATMSRSEQPRIETGGPDMLRPRGMAPSAVVILAIAGASTAASAQVPTQPGSEDFCVFRNELYSFGAIICIGKNRALRC